MANESTGPLTKIATDTTKLIEDILSAALGGTGVAGKTVAELLDDAADHIVATMPSDAPVVGGFAGLIAQLAAAVAKTGGLAANSVAKVAETGADFVQGQGE